ncbi:DUF1919 domain-containing protein [Sphingomonas sp. GB1N7]|uniref:DUF1919 domain-containing protein n=1 Tax=Parasphingomonas caseinilytica TaxID=3096158 RepID=UPI002FC5B43F
MRALTHIRTSLSVRANTVMTISVRRRLGNQMIALDQRGFALLANNCVAGLLYELAALPKRTPTVGIFFRDEAFPAFLDDYARGDLTAWTPVNAADLAVDPVSECPMLLHQGKPAIIFLHYRDPQIAARKWNGRFSRLDGRKPIVIASLRDGLEAPMLSRIPSQYDDIFVIGPAPAPPAELVMLNRPLLRRLAKFFDGILARD